MSEERRVAGSETTATPSIGSGEGMRLADLSALTREAGVRAAFLNAIDAARHRSAELAQGGEDEE